MSCKQVSGLLSPYLDGELEPSERAFVFNHLKICSACRRELTELQAAVQLFRQLPDLAPGPAFRPQLRERLVREARPGPAGVSGSPAVLQNGGRALPSTPRFPVAAAPDGHPGESREFPRRIGLRAAFGAFRSGTRFWPKLAVAVLLLLAMGITSLWYGLAGPGLLPKTAVEQLTGSAPPKGRAIQEKRTEPAGDPERKPAAVSGDDLQSAETWQFTLPGPVPEQQPLTALESGKAPAKKLPAGPAHPEEGQKRNRSESDQQKIFLTQSPAPPENALAPASEKERPGDTGTVYDQEKTEVQKKGASFAAGGSVAAETALDRTALPKKVSRRVAIELTGVDTQKLFLFRDRFVRAEEKPAAGGPAAAAPAGTENPFTVKVETSKMQEFLTQVKQLGKIIKQEETGRDLSADYAKLETELKQKQLQEEELQKIAQNKNSRGIREAVDGSPLTEELKKIQTEMQTIREELQRMDEELKTVSVEIYWRN